MDWRLKAIIQNAVAALPSRISYDTYYWIQRRFGGFRQFNPLSRFSAGIDTWKRIKGLGHDPVGKVFFEVGTGRAPIAPLAYWLMGAGRVITIDLNPYLKAEVTHERLQYISNHESDIQNLFGPLLIQDRLNALLDYHRSGSSSMTDLLELCSIQYIAPGDAAKTGFEDHSVDFHTSYTVFEHIPPQILKLILEEGNRIVSRHGLSIHKIDYSDHFSHSDKTISPINFLQYSDADWRRIAGSRYMYMNRMRHDDFITLFQSAGHQILAAEPDIDERSSELVASGGLKLDARFKGKSQEALSTISAWIVSRHQK